MVDRTGKDNHEEIRKYKESKIAYRHFLVRLVQQLDHQIEELNRILYKGGG